MYYRDTGFSNIGNLSHSPSMCIYNILYTYIVADMIEDLILVVCIAVQPK